MRSFLSFFSPCFLVLVFFVCNVCSFGVGLGFLVFFFPLPYTSCNDPIQICICFTAVMLWLLECNETCSVFTTRYAVCKCWYLPRPVILLQWSTFLQKLPPQTSYLTDIISLKMSWTLCQLAFQKLKVFTFICPSKKGNNLYTIFLGYLEQLKFPELFHSSHKSITKFCFSDSHLCGTLKSQQEYGH